MSYLALKFFLTNYDMRFWKSKPIDGPVICEAWLRNSTKVGVGGVGAEFFFTFFTLHDSYLIAK